jgi:hypothetical protein
LTPYQKKKPKLTPSLFFFRTGVQFMEKNKKLVVALVKQVVD